MGLLGLLLVTLAAISCSTDPAEQEYLAALHGENQGMSRSEQIAHLDRAIEFRPTRARYWETRAVYRIDQRSFAAAQADLDRALKLRERPYLRYLRGLVLCQSGRPGDALADFDAAIAGQPENWQFYRGRALALQSVGRAREALQDAGRLVAKAPQWGESHYARGVALAGLGRDEEAIRAFSEALRRRPELVYPLYARAEAYRRMGNSLLADADRAAAEEKAKQQVSCAPCLDPFRY